MIKVNGGWAVSEDKLGRLIAKYGLRALVKAGVKVICEGKS